MKKVGIVMGSDSDLPILRKAMDTLDNLGIPFEAHVYSAHRTPEQARDFALHARENGFGACRYGCPLGRCHCSQHHRSRDRYPL